jgi:hypothetical protein
VAPTEPAQKMKYEYAGPGHEEEYCPCLAWESGSIC